MMIISASTYLFWDLIIVKIIGIQFLELKRFILIQQVGDVFKIITWTFCIVALVNKKYKFVLICEVLWTLIYYLIFTILLDWAGMPSALYAYTVSNLILAFILYYDYIKNNKKI